MMAGGWFSCLGESGRRGFLYWFISMAAGGGGFFGTLTNAFRQRWQCISIRSIQIVAIVDGAAAMTGDAASGPTTTAKLAMIFGGARSHDAADASVSSGGRRGWDGAAAADTGHFGGAGGELFGE